MFASIAGPIARQVELLDLVADLDHALRVADVDVPEAPTRGPPTRPCRCRRRARPGSRASVTEARPIAIETSSGPVIVGVTSPALVMIVNVSASVQPGVAQVEDRLAGAVARELGLRAVGVEDPQLGDVALVGGRARAAGCRPSRRRSAARRSAGSAPRSAPRAAPSRSTIDVVVAERLPLLEPHPAQAIARQLEQRDDLAPRPRRRRGRVRSISATSSIRRIQVSWRRAKRHCARFIASTSPASSSSKPIAARAVREAPAASALRDLLLAPRAATISSTRASIRARSASRSTVSPTSSVGHAQALAPQPVAGGVRRRSRAARARSGARSACGRWGARPEASSGASSACSASGPRSASSASTSARTSDGHRRAQLELGERGAHVEAGAADDDRPPALGEQLVDLGVRERRRTGRPRTPRRSARTRPAGARAARARPRVAAPLRISRPAVDLDRVAGDRDRVLAALAQQLGDLDRDPGLADRGRPEDRQDPHRGPRSAGAAEQPLVAGERLRGRGLDLDLDQLARRRGAVEVDRLVVAACARAARVASVRLWPSTRTSIVRPTKRWARSRARRWTASTRRSIRSRLTACGTWSSSVAASVPRRGEKTKVKAPS